MRRVRLTVVLSMIMLTPLEMLPTIGVAQNAPLVVVASSAASSYVIPSDFVGFSYEYSMMKPGRLRLAQMPNLIKMTEAIGSNVSIRMGGTASDTATVSATNDQLAGLAGFVRIVATSSPLIEGLNFRDDSPAMDINDASYLSSLLGSQVIYQIGNEPDLYGIPYASYQSQWQSLHNAVVSVVPTATFEGPDIALGLAWGQSFAAGIGEQVVGLSHHNYGTGTLDGTLQDIQTALTNPNVVQVAQGYPSIAQAPVHALPVRMTEAGSINGGGNKIVANTLGAAVTDLRTMILLAQNGWAGINFHGEVYGSTPGGYLPIVNDGKNNFQPQATYYAMWLFSRLQGMRLLPISTNLPANQGLALAVLGPDGAERMLAVNLSVSQSLSVTLQGPVETTAAAVLPMTGPNAMSAQITIGGQSIPVNAAGFSPQPTPTSAPGGSVSLSLAPASAALVTFR